MKTHITLTALLGATLLACGAPTGPHVDAAADGAEPGDATSDTAAQADTLMTVGATGGSVELLHFGDFGDVRPPNPDDTAGYPTAIIQQVMSGMQGLGAQFAVASGDYMFAYSAGPAQAQVDLLLQAESTFSGHIFHSMGNHECNSATAGNCPNENETPNIQQFTTRLAVGQPHVYYDWWVHTSQGGAHFVAVAPNAWSPAQQQWLTATLAMPALYTFVIAHEPPSSRPGPGTDAIEATIAARTGGSVTLRIYGHSHEYRHMGGNQVISGNAGAPLSGFGAAYGFLMIDQLVDGNIQVSAYDVGAPPMVREQWTVTPAGALVP